MRPKGFELENYDWAIHEHREWLNLKITIGINMRIKLVQQRLRIFDKSSAQKVIFSTFCIFNLFKMNHFLKFVLLGFSNILSKVGYFLSRCNLACKLINLLDNTFLINALSLI